MLNGPFPPWPNYTQEEAEAVTRVLLSNRVNAWTGEETHLFEEEFATFSGTDKAIAVANGTLALDLALHGLRIGSHNGGSASDEVIVTPRSFMASASCIVNAGAIPIFADVDEVTQNITPATCAKHLSDNTRGIICVHLAGWPCDIDGFRDLTENKDIGLIEDCAQAHGALYKGRPVGSLGDVAAWSFCQDKIMTTGGEGGMVTCSDHDLWSRMWSFKDHGKSWDAVYNRQHPPGFRWVHESIGTNWRLTEMQSAIGRIQLKRMPDWHAARQQNAEELMTNLASFAGEKGWLRLPQLPCPGCDGFCGKHEERPCCTHAWYRFYAFVRPENLPIGLDRDGIIASLCAQGLPCQQGSCSEIYLEKAFAGTPYKPSKRLPIACRLGKTSIMFFTHPGVKSVTVTQIRE